LFDDSIYSWNFFVCCFFFCSWRILIRWIVERCCRCFLRFLNCSWILSEFELLFFIRKRNILKRDWSSMKFFLEARDEKNDDEINWSKSSFRDSIWTFCDLNTVNFFELRKSLIAIQKWLHASLKTILSTAHSDK
jgi:hypothetical protein